MLIWLLPVALGQAIPLREGVLATDSSLINRATISEAANDLEDLGVDVLVLFVETDTGETFAETEAYLDRALEQYDLRNGETYKNNLFAIYLGTDPLELEDDQRPLYIVYGEDLDPLFQRTFGARSLDEHIRETIMIPNLEQGDFTAAIVAALKEASSQLRIQNLGSTVDPVIPTNNDAADSFNLLGLIVVLGGLLIAFLLFRRARSSGTKQALASNAKRKNKVQNQADKQSLESLIKDLSDEAVSTGHDPYLPKDAGQQSDMILLRKLLKDERPEELSQIESDYTAATQSLSSIQQQLTSSTNDTDYSSLLGQAQVLKAFTESLSERWEDLQLELSNLEAEQAKAEAYLEESFQRYEAARLNDLWPPTKRVFESFFALLSDVDRNKQQARPLAALSKLAALNKQLGQLNQQLPRFDDIAKTLRKFETNLASPATQAFNLVQSQSRLESAKEQFRIALDLLKQDDLKVLDAQVDEAEEQSQALEKHLQAQIELHKSNQKQLTELKQQGERLKTIIDDALPIFERLQHYAQSNWRDIQGNGTEAQKAAYRAYELYLAAEEQQETKNIEEAKKHLDMGFIELEQAGKLIDAIKDRLEYLQQAEASASEQFALVEADIKNNLSHVRQGQVDKLVSELPEQNLEEAARLLELAKQDLNLASPNWLAAMKNIQAADKLAEEAMTDIRSQKEAMKRRTTLMLSEKTEATSALERVVTFTSLHPQDITASSAQLVQEAHLTYSKALDAERELERLSEQALASALESLATQFDDAERKANAAFLQVEANFKAMETLRLSCVEKVSEAEASLKNLANYLNRQRLSTAFQKSFYQLSRAMPAYDQRASQIELEQIMREANLVLEGTKELQLEAAKQAQKIEADLRRQRQELLERERRKRSQEIARQNSSWGSWPNSSPPIIISPPRRSPVTFQRPSSRPTSIPKLPTARNAPPVRLPSSRAPIRPRPATSGRKSGGGWGGSGRKSGSGW